MDAPEQPSKKSMQEQAREAAQQAVEQIRASYDSRYDELKNIQDDGERLRKRTELDRQIQNEFNNKIRRQITNDAEPSLRESIEEKQKKAENAKSILLEAKELEDRGINVVDRKSQLLIDKIVENIKSGEITDQGALAIERAIGKQLIDGIVFSKPGEQLSSSEEGLKNLLQTEPQTANLLLGTVAANPETYGTTAENLVQKLAPSNEAQKEMTQDQMRQQMLENSPFGGEDQYYTSRFTDEQKELISTFYSPERFITYMESLSNGDDSGNKNFLSKAEVADRRHEIEHHIKEYYEKNNKTLTEGELKEQIEKHWGEEVSEIMNWQVSNVINQLFLELQEKSPHKFYEQIMQEDIFQGPAMIQKRIQSAIGSLKTKIDQLEGGTSELAQRMKKLNLFRHTVKSPYIEERGKGPDDPNKKIYPRIKPLPYGEKVGVTDFIENINMNIEHTIHKAEYFHNSRAIYGHPPGEKGFYHQLGEFAEQMHGTDIDEILMLPDGQYIMQAYQLYEKMLQEDFAQMDHRHRPDQFSNKLERVNSEIETQVIEQLRKFYPDLTRIRLKNIVNSAVGISRGMFLTEAEQSAYADPVDSNGSGVVASYSTNDAGSLNVFNPMHTIMRWQGEHNFNSMYFMSIRGNNGKAWNHHEAWKNMAKYMDSFYVGTGRGEGKDKLPDETFADSMMNIGKIGGPGKRKGWRMKQSLEGHFVYDPDGTVNAPKTFQAMEAIGYEAVANFVTLKQAGEGLMLATEKTAPGQVKERRELFKYIFKRYFHHGDEASFQESELDNYLNELKKKGEAKVTESIKNGNPSKPGKSWEEQVAYATSELFMENMLAHYVVARMPTKFMRIDKNRMNKDGVGDWERIWRKFKTKGWERDQFDRVMKDLTMAEMLLRREISEQIRENMKFDKDWTLDRTNEIKDLPYRLSENKIRELLSKNVSDKENVDRTFKTEKEINDVLELYRQIKQDFMKPEYLDSKGKKQIKEFRFTFGLEDTDVSLMAFRGTGPRMVARAIKDTATIEHEIIPWIIQMPLLLNEIAINGKHDFTPVIEYMRKAQRAITDVNGVEDTYEYMYKIAGTVINYFKKDAMAKPLFGLLRLGQKNSIAAEYAGRSSAVWEWDSREIDRFATAMESYGLLKNNPYDLQPTKNKGEYDGGKLEDRWVINPFTKKPMKFNLFGKKRHEDYYWNTKRLRKEFGGDLKAISFDMISQFIPLVLAYLLWKYIKDAMDEASGKKKQ